MKIRKELWFGLVFVGFVLFLGFPAVVAVMAV